MLHFRARRKVPVPERVLRSPQERALQTLIPPFRRVGSQPWSTPRDLLERSAEVESSTKKSQPRPLNHSTARRRTNRLRSHSLRGHALGLRIPPSRRTSCGSARLLLLPLQRLQQVHTHDLFRTDRRCYGVPRHPVAGAGVAPAVLQQLGACVAAGHRLLARGFLHYLLGEDRLVCLTAVRRRAWCG